MRVIGEGGECDQVRLVAEIKYMISGGGKCEGGGSGGGKCEGDQVRVVVSVRVIR